VRELVEKEGVTIILSSHLLDEVQKVCDRVAIINRGELVSEGRVSDLTAGHVGFFIRAAPLDRALALLGSRARADADGLVVDIPQQAAPALIRELVAANIDVFDARWLTQTLERVFLSSMDSGQ